jgi:hypothetical protein
MLHLRIKQLRTPYALTKQTDVEPAWKSICPTKIPDDGVPFPIPISQPPQGRRCDLHRRRKLSGFFDRSAASSPSQDLARRAPLLGIWRGNLIWCLHAQLVASGAATTWSSAVLRPARPLRKRCSAARWTSSEDEQRPFDLSIVRGDLTSSPFQKHCSDLTLSV